MNKKIFLLLVIVYCSLLAVKAQTIKQDTLKNISTTGIFDGKKVMVGNFEVAEVYKINEYCISPEDISQSQIDSLKGKRVLVTGKLKIKAGKYLPAKTSTDGKIYEPYKEPDKKYIVRPVFKIIYDAREPLKTNYKNE